MKLDVLSGVPCIEGWYVVSDFSRVQLVETAEEVLDIAISAGLRHLDFWSASELVEGATAYGVSAARVLELIDLEAGLYRHKAGPDLIKRQDDFVREVVVTLATASPEKFLDVVCHGFVARFV